jgi:hypothetical protein
VKFKILKSATDNAFYMILIMKRLETIKVTVLNVITIHSKDGKRRICIKKTKCLVKIEQYDGQKTEAGA